MFNDEKKALLVSVLMLFNYSISLLSLTEQEKDELNLILEKNYSLKEWNDLEYLDLPRLPDKPFPPSFDSLKNLKIIDIRGTNLSPQNCIETEINKTNIQTLAGDICLARLLYTVIEKIDVFSRDGILYKIKEKNGPQTFVVKFFNNPQSAYKDLLVIKKSRHSKDLLNLPLVINFRHSQNSAARSYAISPFLRGPSLLTLGREQGESIARDFTKACKLVEKLEADGLRQGDNHSGNFMLHQGQNIDCSFQWPIKRIDFEDFIEIPPQLGQ